MINPRGEGCWKHNEPDIVRCFIIHDWGCSVHVKSEYCVSNFS